MTIVRRTGATSAATLCGLALTVVLANALAPRWVQSTGLDIWNLPSVLAASKTAEHDSAQLKAQEQQLYQEMQLSDNIADELAAGSLTLKDAVDEMEPILRNRVGFVTTVQTNYSTSSFREGVALYLMMRIPRLMSHDLLQLSTALSRLEREFESLNRG